MTPARALAGLLLWLASAAVASSGPALDQHGVGHALESPAGQYTVVDFAASWCQPCRRSLPLLEELAREHSELRFLVVDVDDEVAGRDDLVRSLGLTLPVLWDEGYALAERLEPGGMPATFVLSPRGEVLYRHVGFNRRAWGDLVAFLEQLPK